MSQPYRHTGTLRRIAGTDAIEGELRDAFGFSIRISGFREGDAYAVIGTPGPAPSLYALPGDDDPAEPAALWLWSLLNDFEQLVGSDADPAARRAAMPDYVRERVRKVAPALLAWLGELLDAAR